MKQQVLNHAQNVIQLLTRSLTESGSTYSRNTSPELFAFFSAFRTQFQPKPQPTPQKKPEFQQPHPSKLPTPPQPKPKFAAPVKPQVKAPSPQPILPQEPNAPALLELERSHLMKLLPKKIRIDQIPSLDLKSTGIRFTERKNPLPKLENRQTQWLFGISSSLRQSEQLQSFVESIQKAVHEQLQQPTVLCSFMQPLGVAELASISLTQAPIFLFITDTEQELALKILKKVPGFKDDEEQTINESPLHLFTINLQTLNDTQFKRALWSTLKNYAGR